MHEYCIWDKMDNCIHRGPMTQDEAFRWMEKARDIFPVGVDDIWTIKRREIGEWRDD